MSSGLLWQVNMRTWQLGFACMLINSAMLLSQPWLASQHEAVGHR
jgi:hypothetical protein